MRAGIGAVAFQPGQMDVQPDGAAVLCLHHLSRLYCSVIVTVACMESGGVDFSSRLPAGRAEAAVFAPQPASSAASKTAGIAAECQVFHLGTLLSAAPAGEITAADPSSWVFVLGIAAHIRHGHGAVIRRQCARHPLVGGDTQFSSGTGSDSRQPERCCASAFHAVVCKGRRGPASTTPLRVLGGGPSPYF